MTQINTCLKRVFTIFNIIFAIIGGIIIGLALLAQVLTSFDGNNLEDRTTVLIVLYVFGAITMVVALVGAYGAHRESKPALIVFLVCMVIGSLVTLRIAVPAAAARSQIYDLLENKFKESLPLDEAQDDVKNMANTLQSRMHCCGLFSYKDWRQDIPESCDCNPETTEDECRKVNYIDLMSSKYVYSQGCFPILMHYFLMGFDIALGIIFTLAIFALLGLVLSSIMIHQMRFPNRPTVLLSVPAVFTTAPPKYKELHNPPVY